MAAPKKRAAKKPAKGAKAAKKPAKKPAAPRKPRAPKLSDAQKVEALMRASDHPLKAEVNALRKIIRGASPRIEERVKWNAPSYHVAGDDFAAFNLWQREFVQLVLLFRHGLVPDPSGIMEGDWKDKRVVRFDDMRDVRAKRDALARVVRAWVGTAGPHA